MLDLTSIKSILSGDAFRLSKMISGIGLYQRQRADRSTGEVQQWEAHMTRKSFRGFEPVTALLRTLSRLMDSHLPLIGFESLDSHRSILLRVVPVERRLMPAPVPILRGRWRPYSTDRNSLLQASLTPSPLVNMIP